MHTILLLAYCSSLQTFLLKMQSIQAIIQLKPTCIKIKNRMWSLLRFSTAARLEPHFGRTPALILTSGV